MINKRDRSKMFLEIVRNLTLAVIVGLFLSCFQFAWADVDAATIKTIDDSIKEQNNHIGDFSSWVIIANEVDNLIRMRCSLPNLSENCKTLRDLFIKKTEKVYEKSSAYEIPSHAYIQAANGKKFQQKTKKILSYGKSPDLSCNGPNPSLITKQVEQCLPADLSKRILDSTSLDPDVTDMIVHYTLPPKDIEIQSFKECAELNKKNLEVSNIHFSDEMKETIKAILHRSPRSPHVEDLLSDFEGTRNSSQRGQEEKQFVQVQSAKSALLAHIKSYPNHHIERSWEDIKGCLGKLKESQASGRGVAGVDLDFSTGSRFEDDLSGKNSLELLKQYFISKNLKNLSIGDLTGGDLEHFFKLLDAEKIELDSLKISLGHDSEKTNGLRQLRNALVERRLKVKQLSLMGNPLVPHIREYNRELKELIEDPKSHIEELDIYLNPVVTSVSLAVGNAIKKNSTLKSIRVVETSPTLDSLGGRVKFIEGLKENHSIKSIEFQPKGILQDYEVKGTFDAFKNVLKSNKTLTDLRMSFSFGNIKTKYIDLHIHNGKLVGVENAKGLVRYEVLEDFPPEIRPAIQDILVKLNRNAKNPLTQEKKERGEKVSDEKKSLERKEEKKSEETKPHHSSKNSIHGLDE